MRSSRKKQESRLPTQRRDGRHVRGRDACEVFESDPLRFSTSKAELFYACGSSLWRENRCSSSPAKIESGGLMRSLRLLLRIRRGPDKVLLAVLGFALTVSLAGQATTPGAPPPSSAPAEQSPDRPPVVSVPTMKVSTRLVSLEVV